MAAFEDGDPGIARVLAVVDLPPAVGGVRESGRPLGRLLVFDHESDRFGGDPVRCRNDGVVGVQRFADGDAALVAVMDPRGDVERQILRSRQPGEGRALRRFLGGFGVGPGIPFQVPDDLGPVALAVVEGAPGLQVADGAPGGNGGPYLGMTARHEERHVTAPGAPREIDPFGIHGALFFHPLHRRNDVGHRRVGAHGKRIARRVRPPEIRGDHVAVVLHRKGEVALGGLIGAAPGVQDHHQRTARVGLGDVDQRLLLRVVVGAGIGDLMTGEGLRRFGLFGRLGGGGGRLFRRPGGQGREQSCKQQKNGFHFLHSFSFSKVIMP